MKLLSLLPLSITALTLTFPITHAHTIFQKLSVNNQDQGQLKGIRAPSSDYPLMNVNDPNFACNTGIQFKDNTIITIPAGARVGAWWGHVIGGAQQANDPDHPIARSHKGPIIVYLAKVENAATAGTTGQMVQGCGEWVERGNLGGRYNDCEPGVALF
jgi:lytic cellulose monooxygenase (C1-hydroxylating)